MTPSEDITQPIAWPCDPEQDKPRKFTVDDGNYALTAWNVELGKSKKGDPKLSVRFGINGQGGDKWLYHTITLITKERHGHGIAVHALKTLGFSVDKSLVNFRPADILGRVCRAEVRTAEYDGVTRSGEPCKKQKNVIDTMSYALPDDKPEMPKAAAAPVKGGPTDANLEDVPF